MPADAAAMADRRLAGLFRQHHVELVRLAVLLVHDQPTAEDVVQDVFVRLQARRGRFGREGEELAYIRACVLNECRSVLRRRKSRAARPSAPPGTDRMTATESAEATAVRSEERRQVLAALARLPARRREVLVLRYFLGLSEAEIAVTLGISAGSVKSAAARGLAALASALGKEPS
jgi:RNA polymerase sigma-70 factor (sigma-E family)